MLAQAEFLIWERYVLHYKGPLVSYFFCLSIIVFFSSVYTEREQGKNVFYVTISRIQVILE